MQDAEGTVLRANFGSGGRTQDRFENAATSAASLAESDISPIALVGICMPTGHAPLETSHLGHAPLAAQS